MKDLSSEHILEGIENNNSFVIQYVYRKFFKIVSEYILKHGGCNEDVRDIFQDGIMVIYEQRKNNNLKIENAFGTYIYAVCKHKWLKNLRESGKMVWSEIEDLNYEIEKNGYGKHFLDIDELIYKETRARVYQSNFDKMSEECKKMLRMVAKGLSIKEIQLRFNYKSDIFTYKKRSICKNRITELIKQDKKYHSHENY